jgi:hypothetical protein
MIPGFGEVCQPGFEIQKMKNLPSGWPGQPMRCRRRFSTVRPITKMPAQSPRLVSRPACPSRQRRDAAESIAAPSRGSEDAWLDRGRRGHPVDD